MTSPLITAFTEDLSRQGRSPSTIASYCFDLKSFEKFLDGRDPTKLTKNDIRDYVDMLRAGGLSMKSVSHYLAALSSFYEFLIFEDRCEMNPVIPIKKRYISKKEVDGEAHTHKIISVEEAVRLLDCLIDILDKAIVILLLKTGIRLGELISLDVNDINWPDQSILLKKRKSAGNRKVFFDDEAARILWRWMLVRDQRCTNGNRALFPGQGGRGRIGRTTVFDICQRGGLRAGLHDPDSPNMEDHFSPHCCRHWFSTWLSRAKMTERYIEWLRGDVPRGSIGTYIHIDPLDVRQEYLECIPQLGV